MLMMPRDGSIGFGGLLNWRIPTGWKRRFQSVEALAEFAGELFEVGRWDVTKRAAEQFLFEGIILSGQSGSFVSGGADGLVLNALAVCGRLGGDFGLALAVPFDDGWFGDAEAAANSGKT
jgi:hypothetical protein